MPKITDPKEKISATVGALVFFIPHFMEKKTEFVTFYMRQNFGLFLVYLVVKIIAMITLPMFLPSITNPTGSPLLGTFSLIFLICYIVIAILSIFLAVKAYNGEKIEIPYLYKYTNLLIEKVSFLQPLFAPKK